MPRFLRIFAKKANDVTKTEQLVKELNLKKQEQLRIWQKQDESKLLKWTQWRRREEDKLTKRMLPVPLSLTGFGDGAKPRYWTARIRREFYKALRDERLRRMNYALKVPAIVSNAIEKFPEQIDGIYKPVIDRYREEKQELSHKEPKSKSNITKKFLG